MVLTVIGRPLRPGLRLPLFLSRVAAGFPSPAVFPYCFFCQYT